MKIRFYSGTGFVSARPFLALAAAVVLMTRCTEGVVFLSSPEFTPSRQAPLAGVLRVSTDEECRVSVAVDDGHITWERDFFQYAREHAIPLFGFKPARTNDIRVTVHDRNRSQAEFAGAVRFITDPLPSIFPKLTTLKSIPEKMEPGYTLFRLDVQYNTSEWVVIVDDAGEVVWFHYTPSTADVRQLENGNLFMPTETNFVEMNLLGEVVNAWTPPEDLPIDPHDSVLTDHGTILYLAHATNSITEYPTSMTNPEAPTATVDVYFQKLVELDAADSSLLNVWDPMEVLDPRRTSYLIARIPRGWDAHHSNAIIEDPADGGLVVSMRHQHAVIKFARDTGEIVWILGPHENWGPEWQPYLLTPVGSPFEWSYGQHAPVPMGEGRWLLYDNGNDRALPFAPRLSPGENYTRAVEYQIDEERMEVSQTWQYGHGNSPQRLYTPFKGNATPLPQTGNVLAGFSAVTHVDGTRISETAPNAAMVRIQEVTRDDPPEVVFDLAMSVHDKPGSSDVACTIYRALRIPDLYGHPPAPVEDLMVNFNEDAVTLEFSGDAVHSYVIEGSSDLMEWEVIALAEEQGLDPGNFHYRDELMSGDGARFYRVAAHKAPVSLAE